MFMDLHLESFSHEEPKQEEIKEIKEQQQQPAILTVQFTPPKGWRFAETETLPASVKTLVVGQGSHEFPPSLNLGFEVYSGTLKQYLKRVKEINDTQGYKWKDLGKIHTQAGNASLSQVDTKTQWGEVRLMHVIYQEDGIIYILTGAALKEEFPRFYRDFFNAFCSFRLSN